MNKTRLLVIMAIIVATTAVFWFDLEQYLTLESFRARQEVIHAYVLVNPLKSLSIFFVLYVVIALLPLAAIMTLAGGAIFGLGKGFIVVILASGVSAVLAFLLSRYLFRAAVETRFSGITRAINKGILKDGPYYLLTLRLIPIFSFVAISVAMGITKFRTWTFYWISVLGMLPATFIYVNAGTQLSQIKTSNDILSPELIGSFVLLGLFPLITKKVLTTIADRRRRKHYPKPKNYDTNMVVIGAGSAGLVSAYIAAASKAHVILIEQHRMGGDCLNTGCVPSKALIRSSRIASYLRRAGEFGLGHHPVNVEFPKVMQRVRDVIAQIEPHDSIERYTNLGVECVTGKATITSPYCVEVAGRKISTRNIIIASGARPAVPPIPGLAEAGYLTSDTIWNLQELPERLLVLGGGPIGCELAQAFQRLGSQVTLVEALPGLLTREDAEVSKAVTDQFEKDGIRVLAGYSAVEFSLNDGKRTVRCESNQEPIEIIYDQVLIAVGRRANTAGIGLEDIGVRLTDDGRVEVNEYLQATYPNIYACGDVTGPYQLTHAAAHQAWYCAFNALFGRFRKFRVNYSALPWAVFTDPEVARVGINEQEAIQQEIDYEVTRYNINELDRAIADGEAHGFVKVITRKDSDRILGVTIVGSHAGDTIAEYVTAMTHGLGLKKVLGTIHIYPTLSEANRFAGGEWQKTHLSPRLLSFAERYNRWLRK